MRNNNIFIVKLFQFINITFSAKQSFTRKKLLIKKRFFFKNKDTFSRFIFHIYMKKNSWNKNVCWMKFLIMNSRVLPNFKLFESMNIIYINIFIQMTDINFFLLFVSLSAFYHHLKFILLVSILYIYQIDMNIRYIVYVGIILIILHINYFYWNINGL